MIICHHEESFAMSWRVFGEQRWYRLHTGTQSARVMSINNVRIASGTPLVDWMSVAGSLRNAWKPTAMKRFFVTRNNATKNKPIRIS